MQFLAGCPLQDMDDGYGQKLYEDVEMYADNQGINFYFLYEEGNLYCNALLSNVIHFFHIISKYLANFFFAFFSSHHIFEQCFIIPFSPPFCI